MKIITALANEEINKKIKENGLEIIGKDIQYQEAVIQILEINKSVDLLILSSILQGDLNIYEFINIIKYKFPNLEIIIILEKEDLQLRKFIISKGINNIYYNNRTTFDEILEKLKELENKTNKTKINYKNKETKNTEKKQLNKIKKYLHRKLKIINKIMFFKNKKIKLEKNKKIIAILGPPKIGKTIFSLIFSLNIKNKKILIINLDKKKNIKIIIGKMIKKEKNSIQKWKKNIDILLAQKDKTTKENLLTSNQKNRYNEIISEQFLDEYDYIIIDSNNINEEEIDIKKIDKIILLVEANLLGIDETREILEEIIHKQKYQKDNVKIIFNKHTKTSINKKTLRNLFEDFEILGQVQYDNYYNFITNTNLRFVPNKISKQYKKVIKKLGI